MRFLIKLLDLLLISMIRNIDGAVGNTLRRSYYQRRLKYMGRNVTIDTGVYMYGLQYIVIGDNSHIDKYSILVADSPDLDLSTRVLKTKRNDSIAVQKGSLHIGRNCHIAQFCLIFAHGGIMIGDNCVLSTGSKLYSLSSLPFNPSDRRLRTPIVPYNGISPSIIGPIELESNVWLGIQVCVFPGLKIGRDSFARTNSIIMDSFGENSYISGDPAVYVKPRYGGGA